MSSDIKSSTTDQIRLQNQRVAVERQGEMAMRDMEARQAEALRKMIESHHDQLETLRAAYEVQISQEAEQMEDRLHQARLGNEMKIAEERKSGEADVDKIKSQYAKQIQMYRKSSEQQLDQLRKELQSSSERLHNQAKKSQKNQEGSPA